MGLGSPSNLFRKFHVPEMMVSWVGRLRGSLELEIDIREVERDLQFRDL